MAKTLRILFYAINGGGVGHATRLVAIGRWMRRYAAHAGYALEPIFLSSSEADHLLFAEGFPSFKVPSKAAALAANLDKASFYGLVKQWLWHSIGLLRPDLFIVDTFPRGSFGELPACLDLCRRRAFVYRPQRRELAEHVDFQTALGLYDAIVVPDDSLTVPIPPDLTSRAAASGLIAARERVELVTRAESRAQLGIPDGALAVFASAGGGGDPHAAADLAAVKAWAFSQPDVILVLGRGPLFVGAPEYHERLRFWAAPGFGAMLLGADLAISGAGYNSFAELRQAAVPTVFVPQDKTADEQYVRAERAARVGAARIAPRPLSPSSVAQAVSPFLNPSGRAAAASAWETLPPVDGARRAAAQLMRLLVPASEVDAVLASSRDPGVDERMLIVLMRSLAEGLLPTPSLAAEASVAALEFMSAVRALAAPPAEAIRIATLLLRKYDGGGAPLERAGALTRVLTALAPFGDWRGAAALVRSMPARDLSEAASLVERASRGARDAGEDVYRAIQRVVSADASVLPPTDSVGESAP
jgi:UDP-N-acetylglucosamine--N-acetylmuramyl-(pentapeptide) pyrophosphoryl-undecaprenol N-acetylglucosamine transferase